VLPKKKNNNNKRRLGHRQREDHLKTQGGKCHLQARREALEET
jgi:hypothetical protein